MTKKLWFIIIVSIISVIMVARVIVLSLPKYDEEEIEIFQTYKEDFEKINEYIIKNYGGSLEKNNILIDRQISRIVGLYDGEKIKISKELQESFNNIDKAFMGYDFSFLDVSLERISYQGEGYRMYVYSRDGKVPDYYYHKGDGMRPDVYKLGNNWYLLKVNYR